MPVIRTYQCGDCGEIFDVTCAPDDPDPPCKYCEIVMEWRPKKMTIGGSVTSAAVDVTQKILEQDYGLTDWKDNQREGDIAHKAKPQTADERHAVEKLQADAKAYAQQKTLPAAQQFWGKGAPGNIVAQVMADVKQQAASEKDSISRLAKAGKEGKLNIPVNIIAKG